MVQIGQIGPDQSKSVKISQNRSKWSIGQDGQNRSKSVKSVKIGENGQSQSKSVKSVKMVGKAREKVEKIGPDWSKWSKSVKNCLLFTVHSRMIPTPTTRTAISNSIPLSEGDGLRQSNPDICCSDGSESAVGQDQVL